MLIGMQKGKDKLIHFQVEMRTFLGIGLEATHTHYISTFM
jgi:hypothetical protein